MSSNALTVVVLFLPLSSLWASAAPSASGSHEPDTIANRRRKIFGRFQLGSGGTFLREKMLDSPSSINDTIISKESTVLSPVKASQAFVYTEPKAQDVVFRGSPESV